MKSDLGISNFKPQKIKTSSTGTLPYCILNNMISVIVCSRTDPADSIHERNLRKTAGTDIEYIRIDNRDNRYNLSSAYNYGVSLARGTILVFMHEDAFFMEGNWALVLEKKFAKEEVGLIGIAGTQFLFADNPGWVVAGRPYIRGHVIHELNNGETYTLTVFNWEHQDSSVVAVDGLFFAVRASLFTSVRFDDTVFDGFHFYDIDICMQIRRTHQLLVTWDLLIKHQSGGSFDDNWKKYAYRFCKKYQHELPAATVSTTPDPSRRISFENFDLKGKAPQITIQ
ncbi:MAG TPA: glycosyltransferase [Chitinispirillaceae bacterium]|nr:glycosyltransferase [Chitinispirillaceae bacterium]